VVDEKFFKNECLPDRYTATTKNIILQENVDPRSAMHFDLMVNSDVIYGSSFVGVLYYKLLQKKKNVDLIDFCLVAPVISLIANAIS